ncbi:MAG: hypothetical protein WC210_08635 [Candidatus Neomarinimicrobiota bacterium]
MDKSTLILSIAVLSLGIAVFLSIGWDHPQKDTAQQVYQVINMPVTSIEATVTAYTNRVKETNHDPEHTATMSKPVPGLTCAVSRDLLHWLGGRIYIEGYGVWQVDDLMNARYERSIDLYMGDVKAAKEFGRQTLQVVYLGR